MLEYYTVSQYAKVIKKDPGNIRRMLINGELVGEKLGNQWVIPKNSEYPVDKRIKTGYYKNWRKKQQLSKNHPKLLCKLNEIGNKIISIYSGNIEKIVLYGSYARGDETSESDLDVAIILKNNDTENLHDTMVDMLIDYELDLGITISVVPIEKQYYETWNRIMPFLVNLEKEGIVIWKAI